MGASAGVMQEQTPPTNQNTGIFGEIKTVGGLALDVYKGIAIEAANAANNAKNKTLERINKANVEKFGDTLPPDPDDLLLSFKALALCKLSYVASIPNANDTATLQDIEQKWVRALDIEDYKVWYTTEKATGPRSDLGNVVNSRS